MLVLMLLLKQLMPLEILGMEIAPTGNHPRIFESGENKRRPGEASSAMELQLLPPLFLTQLCFQPCPKAS